MILSDFLNNYYSENVELIRKASGNKAKWIQLNILIKNLINSPIQFTARKLAKFLGVSRKLISKVIESIINEIIVANKKETRGRKLYEEKNPLIISQIKEICDKHELVDKSLRDRVVYVNITLRTIRKILKDNYKYTEDNVPAINTIRRILTEVFKYKLTKVKQNKVYKKLPETDKIFDNVNKRMNFLKLSGKNVIGISIDDKANKYVGKLSGRGKSWFVLNALDHDTNHKHIVKPFGIMDLKKNTVDVYCTTGPSTADFKVDCIEEYLKQQLELNPNIERLMIFLDNGPENGSRRTLWKYRIIELSRKYKIIIELIYYPPYHSKYNRIEHYWGVLQRHWGGLIIDDLEKLIGAINSCKWDKKYSNGILVEKEYSNGVKVDQKELDELVKNHVVINKKDIARWYLCIHP